jgi:hypothetical protein
MSVHPYPESDRLHPPAVCCPKCGTRPALRVTEFVVHVLRDAPPERRVGSYKCQRRGCGAIYNLTVAAYRDAG